MKLKRITFTCMLLHVSRYMYIAPHITSTDIILRWVFEIIHADLTNAINSIFLCVSALPFDASTFWHNSWHRGPSCDVISEFTIISASNFFQIERRDLKFIRITKKFLNKLLYKDIFSEYILKDFWKFKIDI